MNLLDKIANIVGVGHTEAVKSIVNIMRKRSEIGTSRAIEFEAKRLVSLISSGKQVFNPKYADKESKISSADHNSNMESAYIDLKGLYKQTDLLSNLQTQYKSSLDDEYSKSRAAILKLINDARVFAIRNRMPEFDDVKLVNFNISRNVSTRSPSAVIDGDSRLLKLPYVLKRRAHLLNRGNRTTTVTATILNGQRGQLGKQFTAEKAVDSKPETFWSEVIYSDVPIQTTYNRWGANADGEISELVNGPIVVLRLSFSGAEAINQIKVLPFSNAPVKVLEITYRPTSSSKIRYPIKGFSVEESLDWVEFNFDTVYTSDIEIVLSQSNYRQLIVHVPKNILYATDFLIRLQQDRQAEIDDIPDLTAVDLGGGQGIYDEAIADLGNLFSFKELDKTPTTEVDLAGQSVLSIGEALTAFNPKLKNLLHEVSSYTEQLPRNVDSQIETINRLEYIIGCREVETNYVVYSPVGYYESERFEPASTISNIELEVDERHSTFTSEFGEYVKTSTEWEVELAEDRKIPIYPSNFDVNGYLPVLGELLQVDLYTYVGISRFKSYIGYAVVRENDIPLLANDGYSLSWNGDYDGHLQITISPSTFDKNKIYTIDYYADPTSKSIDVLSIFKDKALPVPDQFSDTGTNNEIKLSTFPYVNYNIINSENFVYSDIYNAYQYIPPTGAYATGLATIWPEWVKEDGSLLTGISGDTHVSGVGTNWTGQGISNVYLTDPYRYYLKITNLPGAVFEVSSFNGASGLILKDVPVLYTGSIGHEIVQTGFFGSLTGAPPSGYVKVPYTLEVVYSSNDQVYGFDNLVYEPISITVGGIKAKNITSYQSLEQPAFNVTEFNDGEYEYIHDGRTIYFNQKIGSSDIQANYKWITKYVKVNCTLRSNKVVSPTVTPQVNEYRLLLNTTIV